ncbi:MAG: ABC transporter ATP-binding protein [Erythrobacter sp.]|uniref:ABC transporter ATP-binding protein n=1 Tax=Erythrobacter sp. TaxID=1042 RepID=UPI002611BA15|nr:ABC transporter ATP-binding protein [Erythrobacter sp.]MDJ0979384.1 ABC transporter ATP-binding protein [Erythrobacter sp.]
MNFRFLVQRASQYRGDLALIGLVTLLGSAVTLVLPWLAGKLLGGLLGDVSIGVEETLALLIVALVAMTGFGVVTRYLSARASGRILAGLRLETYDHVQAMPVHIHEQAQLGDLLSLMTSEVKVLSNVLTRTLTSVPSNVMTAVGAAVLLILLDPALALSVPLLILVILAVFRLFGRRLRTLAKRARDTEVTLFSMAERDLDTLPAIKSFALEDHYLQNYAGSVEQARLANLKHAALAAISGPLVLLLASLTVIAILYLGATGAVSQKAENPAELFSFLLYAGLLTLPLSSLARLYGDIQWALGTLTRLSEVLGLPRETASGTPPPPPRAKGAISFENVRFAYPGRDLVLDGVSLSIAPGETVVLTGSNGAGKSTLIRLLLRFYDAQSGVITLDGQDIRTLDVQDLRRQIGYVPQRTLLFNGTVWDNITMLAPDASHEAVEHAARLSSAWDLVSQLPDGFQTRIGDKGVRLSGGQRQRIALARALFFNPPILVLDEATSMYDTSSEAAFVERCIEGLDGRTVIIITHRTATLALADRVLRLSPGANEGTLASNARPAAP